MLEKQFRLKKRTEFAYSYKHGKFNSFKFINIVCFKRKDRLLRIGFSVNKKTGNSVTRNKIKRRLRVIVRNNLNLIPLGHNLIIISKPEIVNLNFKDLESELIGNLKYVFKDYNLPV